MGDNQLVQVKQKKLLSNELEKHTELSNSQLYEIGSKVKKYKKNLNQTIDKMDEYMDKNTEKERKAVEEALKTLESKIDKVKRDEKYIEMENEAQYFEEKLNITMANIFPYYSKAIKKIYGVYSDKEERKKKLLEFHEVVGDAFLTKDEKKVLNIIKMKIKDMPHLVEFPLISN